MTDQRRLARDFFDAGVIRLGIAIDGQDPRCDLAQARTAFTRAGVADPQMGDAWLGRLAAGDSSGETLFGLYTARATIGAQQRRLGLPAGTLRGRAPTGMCVDYPVADAVHAALAYAASLASGGDCRGAQRVLDELDGPRGPIVDFCQAVVHLRGREWAAVLTDLSGAGSWDDEYLGAAAELMAGTACVQLGMFDEGLRRLDVARDGPLANCRAQAVFTAGMALRTRGDEAAARSAFQEAFALDPGLSEAATALNDPNYRLVIATPGVVDDDPGQAAVDVAPVAGSPERLAEVERELAEQVGLAAVKRQVARLRSTATLAKVRADKGLRSGERSLHLAFAGPPGTGKTTIARIVAKLYCALGLIATDTVVEATRCDLVGEHLGSTAPKTSAVVDSALDGVLFIDEAYTLIQEGLSGGDAFGREALDVLLQRMETDRDRLVVIVAGYDDEIDRLLAANEGLASRFARRIQFTSYTPDELTRIAEVTAASRDARLTAGAAGELSHAFDALHRRVDPLGRRGTDLAGNGRFVRNVVEAAEEEREHRLASHDDLADLTTADLMTITAADVRAALVVLDQPVVEQSALEFSETPRSAGGSNAGPPLRVERAHEARGIQGRRL
ncbi:MAG: type VII secretion AAA-ATPase EccA [Gordonia sp. (in: high G+C Gram-positive bacteria)]